MAGQLQRDLSQLGIVNQGFHVISQDMLSLQCHTPQWYFCRREIEDHSPSRKDCIDLKTETQRRVSYCSFLQDLGIKLKVPQVTIATAMMLCHRFYMRQSHAKNGWQTLATVSMFLACKVEETPRLLMDIVVKAYEMMHRSDPAAAQRIKHKDVYQKQKELIITGERFLLTTIAFDLNIQTPYKPLVAALKRLKIAHNDLAKVAWNFVNDWLRTTLCLQYKPHYIAAGSMYLAAKIVKVKLPSDRGKAWWLEFDVSPHQLEEVIKQMLGLLGHDRRLAMPSLHAKARQASVGTKKAQSIDQQQASIVISSVTTCDSICEIKAKPRGDGELKKSNDAYICDTQSFTREDTSDCAARSGETPQFQTSDCGSSHSIVEDGNRSDEGEVQATMVVSNEITVIKIVSDCGGLGKIDKDRIKEALKKRKYCGLANKQAGATMEETRDDDSWIVRELECGVELAYASEDKRQKLH